MTLKALVNSAPITLTLMVLFVGIFGVQALLGVSIDDPDPEDIIRFGGNFLPLTVHQPFRLLTAGFIHIGLMHLMFNSFAIYFLGQVCEKILGAWRYLSVFLLSVIAGSLLSLGVSWYHFVENMQDFQGFSVGAGASGGIMGLGAVLVVLALSNHPVARFLDKKNLLIVMTINLLLGFFVSGIDNAAHIGGAVCGLVFGFVVAYLPKAFWIAALLLLLGFLVGFYGLYAQILPYLS